MRASVLDRCGGLARGHERAHEAERGVGTERVERREPAPPVGCRAVVAARRRVGRETRERFGDALRQVGPLAFDPALELPGPVEVEAVEEGARVQRHGAC